MSHFVIVGAGMAGAKAAEALRERGFDGDITLVGDEELLPYERPPLSKGYLMGSDPWDEALVHPEDWYGEHNIQLRLGNRAQAMDLDAHTVDIYGELLHYDKLLLATGSEPRRLPGLDADGLYYLRRKGDSDAIRATFGEGRRMVIVGGGWIGLEVAAAARQAGTDVTIVESAPLPLSVLGPELAEVFAGLHREHGVDLRTGVQVGSLDAHRVALADGTAIDADAVLVGVGARPATELAEKAGLAVDNGVLVDASLRSSHPDVYVAGDIANAEHPLLGGRIRVEHWANALNQPAVAAAAMLGENARYDELPYFFTDQYDLGMEYIGHAPPGAYSHVVTRGDRDAREFIAFWLDDQSRLLAGMNVNVWDVVEPIKAIIRSRRAVDPARLADPNVPLESV